MKKRKNFPHDEILSNEDLDDDILWSIDNYPEDPDWILNLIYEKQYRVENEIYISETKSLKKNAIQKEKEKRYRDTKSKARHIINARAVSRDLERKEKRVLRNGSVAR